MAGFKDIFRRNKRSKKRPNRPEYRDSKVQPRLPASRPRALTLPLPLPPSVPDLPTDAVKQRIASQAASPLMRLPIEIRMQIYEAVLGNRKVHVAFSFGSHKYRTSKNTQVPEWRWWHTICSRDQMEDGDTRTVWDDRCVIGKVNGDPGPPNGMMGKLKLDFALLLTCRQVYSEAIDILYSTTTFNFASHELLRSFPSLILPHRFAAITSIEQMWTFINLGHHLGIPAADRELYNDMWSMLASMPNLQSIRIAVAAYECPNPAPADLQKIWLEPLEQLRGKNLKTFEVMVSESYAKNFNVDKTSHFKLITTRDLNVHHMGISCFCSG